MWVPDGNCQHYLLYTFQFQVVKTNFWKVHTECAHVQPIEEASKALVEAVQALIEELQVHEICFQVGHAIT